MLEMHRSNLPIPRRLNSAGRRIRMAGMPEESLWCLADWCSLLGYADLPSAVQKLIDGLDAEAVFLEKPPDDPGGCASSTHEKWYIKESAVYYLILDCELPTAKPFQEWIFSEVLPSIRKHGCYPPPSAPQVTYQRWREWFNTSFLRHYAAVYRQKPGGFSVLCEIKAPLLIIAKDRIDQGLPVDFGERPDLAVEAAWEQHRKRKGFPEVTTFAPLDLPEQDGTVYVKVYGPEEHGEFDLWLSREYLPATFPGSFAGRSVSSGTQHSEQLHRR